MGLQVFTCVCKCTWPERGECQVRAVPTVSISFRDTRNPILSPLGDGVPFSTFPVLGPSKWLLFLVTHAPCLRWWSLVYRVPAPAWRGQ